MQIRLFGCARIIKDDECIGVVHPFDLEAAIVLFPLLKDGLDVAGLQFGWKATEGQDAGRERSQG